MPISTDPSVATFVFDLHFVTHLRQVAKLSQGFFGRNSQVLGQLQSCLGNNHTWMENPGFTNATRFGNETSPLYIFIGKPGWGWVRHRWRISE